MDNSSVSLPELKVDGNIWYKLLILEKALGINPKDLERNQAFLDTISANDVLLEPSEQWTWLGRQQKNFHNKSGKKNGKR